MERREPMLADLELEDLQGRRRVLSGRRGTSQPRDERRVTTQHDLTAKVVSVENALRGIRLIRSHMHCTVYVQA
jgi:hypothetical protein